MRRPPLVDVLTAGLLMLAALTVFAREAIADSSARRPPSTIIPRPRIQRKNHVALAGTERLVAASNVPQLKRRSLRCRFSLALPHC
jgi:hypothetical protein